MKGFFICGLWRTNNPERVERVPRLNSKVLFGDFFGRHIAHRQRPNFFLVRAVNFRQNRERCLLLMSFSKHCVM